MTQAPQPVAGSSESGTTSGPTTDSSSTSGPSATNAEHVRAPQPITQAAQVTNATAVQGGDEARSSTPREAAALAALRRLDTSQSSLGTRSIDPRSTNITSPATVIAGEATSLSPPVNGGIAGRPQERRQPTEPTSTIAATSDSVPSPASAAAPTAPDDRPQAPPLIPLWDPIQYAQQMRASMYPWQQMPVTWPQQPAGQRLPTAAQASPTSRPSVQTASRGTGQDSRYSARQPQEPLSQLPATLTEEQLTRLDRLTREAIDERLRVLEGVSGTLWRCIQELHRMRSILPTREAEGLTPTPTQDNTPSEPASATGNSSSQATNTDKGKAVSTGDPQGAGTSSSTDNTPIRSMNVLD